MDQPDQPRPPDLSARLARAAPWLLVAYALGLWLLAVGRVPSAPLAAALSLASWLGFTALLVVTTAGLTALRLGAWAEALVLAAGAGGWAALSFGFGKEPPLAATVLAPVCMVVAVVALGRLVARVVRDVNLLPVILVLMGLIDIWGVYFGFTHMVAERNPEMITKASATVPGVATAEPTAFPLVNLDLSIGPGDILFLALVLSLVMRAGFDLRRNLTWIYGLTIGGLALVLLTNLPIPGLVFIGLAGIVANWGRFHYSADEKRSLWIVGGLLVVGTIAAMLFWPRPAPEAPDAASPTDNAETDGRER